MYRSIQILTKLKTKQCESVVGLGAEAILLAIITFVVPQRLDDRARPIPPHASVSIISSFPAL